MRSAMKPGGIFPNISIDHPEKMKSIPTMRPGTQSASEGQKSQMSIARKISIMPEVMIQREACAFAFLPREMRVNPMRKK